MSADLFAAFEDTSKPSQKGQPSKTSAQSDPFSFGINNATNPGSQIGHFNTQHWSNSPQPTSWSGQAQSTQPFSGALSQSVQSKAQDDDDGWGDFEVAPTVNQSPATSAMATAPSRPAPAGPQNPAIQRTRVVRASTMDLISNNLLDLGSSSVQQANVRKPAWNQGPSQQVKAPTPSVPKAPGRSSKRDSNVLFDADDFNEEQEDEDEDFGEFETVASPVQATTDILSSDSYSSPITAKTRASDLLSGLSLGEPAAYPQAPKSPSFQDRNPFPGLAVAPPPKTEEQLASKKSASPATAWPSLEVKNSAGSDGFGDEWGAFDEFPDEQTKPGTNKTGSNWDWDSVETVQPKPIPTSTPVPAPTTTPKPKDSSWNWDPIDVKTEKPDDQPKDDSPPTNIPPPSVLLSVFPQLFDQANTSLYKPVSGQSFSTKNRILSDPKTIEFLKGYLALATVAARVIAGRKLRWHRDKFLAQRMTISAAGSKGMKLAGVDKAQAAREDREAADVVAVWKEHIGRLRSAVATANSSIKSGVEQLKVPEIFDSMPIQTEKMAATAPKACVVCGLKRNERVSKVDYDVEDSFGEWWAEHWGHLACKRFWLQHESTLRQR
ncbi:RNA binding protein, heterogenous nuclear RNP-K like protein [Hypoxylon texense]